MKHEGYNEFFQRGRFDFPIEFYHVEANHPRFHMPYHWHMEYEIIWVKQGALHLILNETDIHAKAGDVVLSGMVLSTAVCPVVRIPSTTV